MKMIKLSLVAAVAVAGLTSTASAGNLSEMIQGVKTSGYVRYRNTNLNRDAANTASTADENLDQYKIVVNNKIPVNDNVAANVKLVLTGAANDTIVNQANFTYTNGGVAVTAGLQGYGLPVTNDATGTGAKAVVKAGPATIIAAGFSAEDADAGSNAKAAAVVVPAGSVTLTAMVAEATAVGNTTKEDDFTYFNAKAKVAGVALNVTSIEKERQDTPSDDIGAEWIKASTNVAGFGLTLGYASTGKNNDGADATKAGNYNIADGGAADRTAADFGLIQTNAASLADADITLIKVAKNIGPVNVMLGYADSDLAVDTADQKETVAKVTYKMSKNFMTYVWVSEKDVNNGNTSDNQKTRLEIKYSF